MEEIKNFEDGCKLTAKKYMMLHKL